MKRIYSEAIKYELVNRYQNGESVTDICLQADVPKSTFYSWLKPYTATYTKTGQIVSAAESAKMKTRIKKLEQIIEVLKKVNCTVSSPLKERLNELALLHGEYSVHALCEALEVPRGTFYNHVFRNKRENNTYRIRRDLLSEKIKQIFEESNQIYGAKKIKAILTERGEATSDEMVSRLMQEMNLSSVRPDAKKNYIRLNYKKKKDSLQKHFSAPYPNSIWVSDVTIFNLDSKSYYICVILDLYSRKVIAYKISRKNSTQLISGTFRLAYADRRPEDGLTFHSDRGTQYTSHSFQALLKKCHVNQSFSPSGKPCHNAVMESFFSSMKKEELYRANYHSANELKERLKHYMDFYNNERPHSTLSYRSPNTHERLFYERSFQK